MHSLSSGASGMGLLIVSAQILTRVLSSLEAHSTG